MADSLQQAVTGVGRSSPRHTCAARVTSEMPLPADEWHCAQLMEFNMYRCSAAIGLLQLVGMQFVRAESFLGASCRQSDFQERNANTVC